MENVLVGVTARVFRGALHPTELATRLVREIDLNLRSSDIGPVAANAVSIRISAFDMGETTPPSELEEELNTLLEAASLERGWRLEGPADVAVLIDRRLGPGVVAYELHERPGVRTSWGRLRSSSGNHEIRVNRAVVGRGSNCDIVIDDSTVSRRHALIWHEADRIHLQDLGSANGTTVDGTVISSTTLENGSMVQFGAVRFRLEVIVDA